MIVPTLQSFWLTEAVLHRRVHYISLFGCGNCSYPLPFCFFGCAYSILLFFFRKLLRYHRNMLCIGSLVSLKERIDGNADGDQ